MSFFNLDSQRNELILLSSTSFQSFLNYLSSHARSCGMTLALMSADITHNSKKRYIEYFSNELFMGVACLGLGSTLHPDKLHTPRVLARLVRLSASNMLGDFQAVLCVVQDTISAEEDPHLMHYEGNWWSKFSDDTKPPTVNFTVFYNYWFKQRATLPRPKITPVHVSFDLSLMVEQDLKELEGLLQKMSEEMDADIEATQSELTRLTVAIAKVDLQILELKREEAEAVEAEEACIRAELSKGEGTAPRAGGKQVPSLSQGAGTRQIRPSLVR
ncbi:hypothetical protein FA13DRAFT_1789090 [Coprinellus micaceus]|uniref:Uncharacterized protein n=1 Tax=Coprinellus micaceus TaxID=71717 RepID=A0A4Y7TKI6_COPMI|nr:hypothetical protein FA13DRAFT_1789090 [Coprinellus micaceus]